MSRRRRPPIRFFRLSLIAAGVLLGWLLRVVLGPPAKTGDVRGFSQPYSAAPTEPGSNTGAPSS